MKKLITRAVILLLACLMLACSKDDESSNDANNNTDQKKYHFKIDGGSKALSGGGASNGRILGERLNAVFVDESGNEIAATNVTWSSSNDAIAKVTGSSIQVVGGGAAFVTATTSFEGQDYETTSPVRINSGSDLFTVAPQMVMWSTDVGTMPMFPVYLGAENVTFSYTSSDASIASVDASGEISFHKTGNCIITVTGVGLPEGQNTFDVPVVVFGEIEADLPVAKVVVDPQTMRLFKGETQQINVTAYDGAGNVVTDLPTTYTVENDSFAVVSSSGLVEGVLTGETKINVEVAGIEAEVQVKVYPKYVAVVWPFLKDLKKGESTELTAKVYNVDKDKGEIGSENTGYTVGDLVWEPLSLGIDLFDIFEIEGSNKGATVTVKSKGSSLGAGSSFIVVHNPSDEDLEPGVGMITLGVNFDLEDGLNGDMSGFDEEGETDDTNEIEDDDFFGDDFDMGVF